jgi:hypothetical protein
VYQPVLEAVMAVFNIHRLAEHSRAGARALALEPDDPWVLYFAHAINAKLDRRREAVDYLKQAIAHGWLGIHYLRHPDVALKTRLQALLGSP